jgi:hypothetical protein
MSSASLIFMLYILNSELCIQRYDSERRTVSTGKRSVASVLRYPVNPFDAVQRQPVTC